MLIVRMILSIMICGPIVTYLILTIITDRKEKKEYLGHTLTFKRITPKMEEEE